MSRPGKCNLVLTELDIAVSEILLSDMDNEFKTIQYVAFMCLFMFQDVNVWLSFSILHPPPPSFRLGHRAFTAS